MAKMLSKVYLGYEDEPINENNLGAVNYTINKIGGSPDWLPVENMQFPSKCPLCGLHRLLLLQCYAPLDNSPYHRTLYLFGCINPNCWIQSESWLCIRSQALDLSNSGENRIVEIPTGDTNVAWCDGADEWDDNDNVDDSANGNFMNIDNVDNAACPNNFLQKNSDEDDESNSFELDTVEQAFESLQVYDAHNANMSPVRGAVGAIGIPIAAAELEGGDEPGLVSVDTPTSPSNDVQALLQQNAELPHDLRSRLLCGPLQFVAKYIYVEEESKKKSDDDDKVNELLNKYKKENDVECGAVDKMSGGAAGDDDAHEPYEHAAPPHGDRLFHAFLTRLKQNPTQILRYSRDEPPILGAPLPSNANTPDRPFMPLNCQRCGSKLICEIQLMPQFGNSLQLITKTKLPYLHFLSVLIFTCSQSCWQSQDSFVKETVVFQPEVV